jgi:hypothetical protein
MSDREEIQQICDATHHKWIDEYYGQKCETCGIFIPYGCEPWMPLDDDPPGVYFDIDSGDDFAESELSNEELDPLYMG